MNMNFLLCSRIRNVSQFTEINQLNLNQSRCDKHICFQQMLCFWHNILLDFHIFQYFDSLHEQHISHYSLLLCSVQHPAAEHNRRNVPFYIAENWKPGITHQVHGTLYCYKWMLPYQTATINIRLYWLNRINLFSYWLSVCFWIMGTPLKQSDRAWIIHLFCYKMSLLQVKTPLRFC